MSERVLFVRAQIMNELPSGKVQVAIHASDADGIRFYTNPEHVFSGEQIAIDYHKGIREKLQFMHGVASLLTTSGDERDADIANLLLPKLQSILYPNFNEMSYISHAVLSDETVQKLTRQDGDEE